MYEENIRLKTNEEKEEWEPEDILEKIITKEITTEKLDELIKKEEEKSNEIHDRMEPIEQSCMLLERLYNQLNNYRSDIQTSVISNLPLYRSLKETIENRNTGRINKPSREHKLESYESLEASIATMTTQINKIQLEEEKDTTLDSALYHKRYTEWILTDLDIFLESISQQSHTIGLETDHLKMETVDLKDALSNVKRQITKAKKNSLDCDNQSIQLQKSIQTWKEQMDKEKQQLLKMNREYASLEESKNQMMEKNKSYTKLIHQYKHLYFISMKLSNERKSIHYIQDLYRYEEQEKLPIRIHLRVEQNITNSFYTLVFTTSEGDHHSLPFEMVDSIHFVEDRIHLTLFNFSAIILSTKMQPSSSDTSSDTSTAEPSTPGRSNHQRMESEDELLHSPKHIKSFSNSSLDNYFDDVDALSSFSSTSNISDKETEQQFKLAKQIVNDLNELTNHVS